MEDRNGGSQGAGFLRDSRATEFSVMIQVKSQPLSQQASTMLANSSVRELREIRVDEDDETLELSGQVRSYYHKQLAQETIRSAAMGRRLINRLKVSP